MLASSNSDSLFPTANYCCTTPGDTDGQCTGAAVSNNANALGGRALCAPDAEIPTCGRTFFDLEDWDDGDEETTSGTLGNGEECTYQIQFGTGNRNIRAVEITIDEAASMNIEFWKFKKGGSAYA